ncbi:hypothetical protein [Bacillus cereus group sp. BfR-BA-01451]|nr:hypothetical protein [Bacillus cereus group sp. BfR-BA-01451]
MKLVIPVRYFTKLELLNSHTTACEKIESFISLATPCQIVQMHNLQL